MHIAFLGHVARFSGAEIELLRVVEATSGAVYGEALSRPRWTLLLAEDGPLVPALREAGATVEVIPLAERTRAMKRTDLSPGLAQARAATDTVAYIARVAQRLRALSPDVVSAVSLKAAAYGAFAARLAGRPFVVHLHDQIAATYLAGPAVKPMRALLGTLPSAIITPSQATLDTVGSIRPGIRTAVIPHPVPRPAVPVPVSPTVQRIGIIGRLTPWKGQDVFLRAFAKAVPDPKITAVVIGAAMFGEERYEQELRALAATLGLGERVEFTGFREDVPAEMARLDLLVHASVLTEPGATVVFEAMAAGLPVIAARSGGAAEHIDDGVHGLLHTPGDVDALAAAMRRAIDDAPLRRRLAAAGRELTEPLTARRVFERWNREIYTHLAPMRDR